jgi:hypothetical protein
VARESACPPSEHKVGGKGGSIRILKLAITVFFLLAVASRANAQKVTVDFDPHAAFSDYKTFMWIEPVHYPERSASARLSSLEPLGLGDGPTHISYGSRTKSLPTKRPGAVCGRTEASTFIHMNTLGSAGPGRASNTRRSTIVSRLCCGGYLADAYRAAAR